MAVLGTGIHHFLSSRWELRRIQPVWLCGCPKLVDPRAETGDDDGVNEFPQSKPDSRGTSARHDVGVG